MGRGVTYDNPMEIVDGTNVHVLYKGSKDVSREYNYRVRAIKRGIYKFTDINIEYSISISGLISCRAINANRITGKNRAAKRVDPRIVGLFSKKVKGKKLIQGAVTWDPVTENLGKAAYEIAIRGGW